MGVNCYAEVFLEVPDVALSGINIDPKAVTVYPTTRVYGGVAVQKEFLTGKSLGRSSQKLQDAMDLLDRATCHSFSCYLRAKLW